MTNDETPSRTRAAARVLVISDTARLLLLHAVEAQSGSRWWVAPGGGLMPDEAFEEAARRELEEETGILASIGPCVWIRRHIYRFEGRQYDQYERFFVARVRERPLVARQADSYIIGHRWWSLAGLRDAGDTFAPRKLALLIEPILRGEYPDTPIDCGV